MARAFVGFLSNNTILPAKRRVGIALGMLTALGTSTLYERTQHVGSHAYEISLERGQKKANFTFCRVSKSEEMCRIALD